MHLLQEVLQDCSPSQGSRRPSGPCSSHRMFSTMTQLTVSDRKGLQGADVHWTLNLTSSMLHLQHRAQGLVSSRSWNELVRAKQVNPDSEVQVIWSHRRREGRAELCLKPGPEEGHAEQWRGPHTGQGLLVWGGPGCPQGPEVQPCREGCRWGHCCAVGAGQSSGEHRPSLCANEKVPFLPQGHPALPRTLELLGPVGQ